jgi:pyruvate-ferredoxin/flavodoxin oxidoreductase
LDFQRREALRLLAGLAPTLDPDLARALAETPQTTETDLREQRARVAQLRQALQGRPEAEARRLADLAEALVTKSVWIVGGDGWAYDIGYGGLDHVLASGRNVNVLVLDTEVYSNTGGQTSKATRRGAVARFSASGKPTAKKDLGLLAMTYGDIYVARVAMGADDAQAVRAFVEAEAYPGPSLIIAYSHCIHHGFEMRLGLQQQKAAVASGAWPLYRYHPGRRSQGLPGLVLDSKPPSLPLEEFLYREVRFHELVESDPQAAEVLLAASKEDVRRTWETYQRLAEGAAVPQVVSGA